MKIIWTAQALQALLLVREHIEKDNKTAAARIANRLRVAANRLAAHPEMGRPGRVGSTRELVVHATPYLLYYRVREGWIEILAVIHVAQEWPEQF
jgi:addiction module RelE/StbE family toxin